MLLAIEIGGSKLQLAAGEASGQILQRKRFAVERSRGADGIRERIEQSLPELLQEHRCNSIGVGFGGPVDWKTGRICKSHHIEGWSGIDLAGWLRELSGLPVSVDNDASVAALGEAHCGAGGGLNPVFYVTLGSGVGGGLVVDGKIYHGAPPGESELGHVRLDRSGTTVESRCSGWAVDARIRALKSSASQSMLAGLIGNEVGGEAQHLAAALAGNDSAAQAVLNELSEDLAFGLSHVVHLFHPAAIILGGGLSEVGEPLRSSVETALKKYLMEVFLPGPQIRLSALREDAVPVGALRLASAG
jgi:glucokinase